MPPEHRAHVLSRVVCLLHQDRVRVLEILLTFLRELSKFSDKTLMNQHNLAIVFAPNILRSGTDNPGQVITDAKATLEIVNLLLSDPSITSLRMEEVHRAPQSLKKRSEFKKTMQENYLAIRKDSTRKLEQASRKSRVSASEFNKKMEQLSQRIIEGEIDAALFDEAALKFMDPQLVAQFGGQDQLQFAGSRANRQQRNANRNITVMLGSSSPPSSSAHAIDAPSPSSLSSSLEIGWTLVGESGPVDLSMSPRASNVVPHSLPNSSPSTSTNSEEDQHHHRIQQQQNMETSSSDTSEHIVSPRAGVMPRTKPSLQRATSASSGTTIEVGLQRNNRSAHLSSVSVSSSSSTKHVISSSSQQISPSSSSSSSNANASTTAATTVAAPATSTSPSAQNAALSLGTHRPKDQVSAPTSSSSSTTSSSATSPPIAQLHQEWHRSAARHRQSDPMAIAALPTKDSFSPAPSPPITSTATTATSTSTTSTTSTATTATSPNSNTSLMPVDEDDEDLDHIMGDLLGPYQPKYSPRDFSHSESSPLGRTPRSQAVAPLIGGLTSDVAASAASAASSSSSAASAPASEAATIVTLELLELMLGQSELPEIVVPADEPEENPEEDEASSHHHHESPKPTNSTNKSNMGISTDQRSPKSEEDVEVEVETAAPQLFPKTGLFSSPLIMSSANNRMHVQEDPSIPSMGTINAILSQQQQDRS